MPAPTPSHAVTVSDGHAPLEGDLQVPAAARGLVIFAHGSGSSRFSSRNRQVAAELNDARFATLLMDLLTREESRGRATGEYRFDIPRLGRRVIAACDWAEGEPLVRDLPIGGFGASTGAAAALVAAAERPLIAAVVSRGGRPDMAGAYLPRVQAPTLLIVGGNDVPVIGMNEDAKRRMSGEARLEIVPGATHLFEEPGALERVSRLAIEWFERHLVAPTSARSRIVPGRPGRRSAERERGSPTETRTLPVPADEWDDVLDTFAREHRAWLAHVERDDREAAPSGDRPLVEIRPERHGARVVAIRIEFGMDAGDATTVRIEEPVAVAFETTPDGTSSGLRIEDASGRQARLRFRVEPPAAMLDGVAPGEM
jgi:putative phosphoribosyl transferase